MIRSVLNNPYWYSKERLSDHLCDLIIADGKNLFIEEAGIFGNTGDKKLKSKEIRKSNVGFFPKGHTIEKILHSHVALANLEAGWNFAVTGKELIQFGEYKNKGFYDWHRDTNFNPNVPLRKLSVTVQLSDPKDYAGGNLEMKNIKDQELRMPLGQFRKRGTVIVFPSMLYHRVSPVERGTRYSLVQWFNGPDFS